MSDSLKCPSCGASISEEHRFDESYTCEFCGNVAYFQHAGVKLGQAGQQAAAVEGLYTRFALGQSGSVRGSRFTISGRVVYDYGEGYWSEWLLRSDQDSAWLHEDEGVYLLLTQTPVKEEVPPRDRFRVGQMLEWNGLPRWFLTEVRTAKVLAVEGAVPSGPVPGREIFFADGLAGGKVLSLDLGADGSTPRLLMGTPLEYEEIVLDSEKGQGEGVVGAGGGGGSRGF